MIQVIFEILKKGLKFSLLIGFILLFISFFGDYISFALYHINLALYFFMGGYMGNSTILLLSFGIIFIFILFIYKLIKKFI